MSTDDLANHSVVAVSAMDCFWNWNFIWWTQTADSETSHCGYTKYALALLEHQSTDQISGP